MEEGRISYVRRSVRVLPALLIAAGVGYDIAAPLAFSGAPFLVAAPLVAAPLYSQRGTVGTGIAAIGSLLVVRLSVGGLDEVEAVTELVTVIVVSALAVAINVLVRRGGERLASARRVAEAVQRAVLPEPPERVGGLQVAARYEAAQEDASIGGDLYAVQDTPHGVRMIVGDVCGKGLGAVGTVAVVIGAFQEAAEQESTLEGVAQRLERALASASTRRDERGPREGFTTAVLAELPPGAPVVRLVNRGHPPPLLLYADGAVRPLTASDPALPLGMGGLGTWPDRADEAEFPSGATLLLYTDGLSEARDRTGRFYDPEQGLAGRANALREPAELLRTLAGQARRHSGGGMADDLALLAVRRPDVLHGK
ncbi:PP2C family protein-serine/threonine phosphatase [Streptomyces sp. NPDC001651]|uniref:PP2C family protein-serine/threonine phosphatase n=1 Tax=Streptomyces sp. NPDC001651 TaxID=3364596 RepID=UPI0036CF2182